MINIIHDINMINIIQNQGSILPDALVVIQLDFDLDLNSLQLQ